VSFSAENYREVVAQIESAGLILDGGLQIGTDKPVRCRIDGDRERRGWYRLTTIDIGGETHLVGAYGIWRGTDNGKVAIRPDRKVKLSHEQRAAISERIAADARRAKAARQADAERAAARAAKLWRVYQAEGQSAYLERKGVPGLGLRYHPEKDTIAVPMMDPKGKIWGVQLIRGSDRGKKLEKQYWPKGLDKVGHYHLIGGSPRDLLIIAEGYATAATVQQAISAPTAVAFDANNLLPVAKGLRRQYPRARILIAADDDYRTEGNPGTSAAAAAALAVDGRWLAPVFAAERPQTGKKGATDWNDLAQLEGEQIVRAQLETFLTGIGWAIDGAQPRRLSTQGGGDAAMAPRLSVDDAAARYWGTYGFGGKLLFDQHERRLVHKDERPLRVPARHARVPVQQRSQQPRTLQLDSRLAGVPHAAPRGKDAQRCCCARPPGHRQKPLF